MKTPFDNMFDFDGDGNLNWIEQVARDYFVMNIIRDIESKGNDADSDNGREADSE